MTTVMYVNHETAEVYNTKEEAIKAYGEGATIDLYAWRETLDEWMLIANF